jgi:hypothetical protein
VPRSAIDLDLVARDFALISGDTMDKVAPQIKQLLTQLEGSLQWSTVEARAQIIAALLLLPHMQEVRALQVCCLVPKYSQRKAK